MKLRKEKNNKKILVILIFLGKVIAISSCQFIDDPFLFVISGDFIYTKRVSDEGIVLIIDLSEEGKTKETLMFPSILDDYYVHSLGAK